MSGKQGLLIGILIGLGVGLAGVMVTMHLLSEHTVTAQAEAYDRGVEAGMKLVAADGLDISAQLNQGMADENSRLAEKLTGVKTQLQALQSRDDLTPQAKEQIAGIMSGLE